MGMTCALLALSATGCGNVSTGAESVMPIEEVETTEEDRLMDDLYESGHYIRNCEIIAVENVNGDTVCIVEGRQHYMYAFYGNGFKAGDVAECVFWEGKDNTTRADDELVDVWDVY